MKAPGTAYDDRCSRQGPAAGAHGRLRGDDPDNGGVHINSGIPNHAFYLVATELGGNAWEKAGAIWYATLRDSRLQPTARFQHVRADDRAGGAPDLRRRQRRGRGRGARVYEVGVPISQQALVAAHH